MINQRSSLYYTRKKHKELTLGHNLILCKQCVFVIYPCNALLKAVRGGWGYLP